MFLAIAPAALAGTPAGLLVDYETQARREDAAFVGSSAERGGELYRGSLTASGRGAASCASCHSSDPLQSGRHARTGKAIAPLAPAANSDRFTDPAKAEKWFGRNCRDVLGRECTAREKADFVHYLTNAK
jgi:Domain of unknown function (DUF1924)